MPPVRHSNGKRLKRIAVAILLLGGLGGGYYYYKVKTTAEATPARVALAEVTRGALVVTVEGSGQVLSVDEAAVRPSASGDVLSVAVKVGDKVKAGSVLLRLDATDAQKAVRDAQINLETAQLALEKLEKPADALSVMKSENSLTASRESAAQARVDLADAIEDGYDAVSNAFLDMPEVVNGLQEMLLTSDSSTNSAQWNIDYYADTSRRYDERVMTFRDDAEATYRTMRAAYDANLDDFKAASRADAREKMVALIDETYQTALLLDKALKSSTNFLQFYQDIYTARNLQPIAMSDRHISSLSGWTRSSTSFLSNLLQAKAAITTAQERIVTADRTVRERESDFAELQAPPDELDLRGQRLTIEQRETSLADAQAKLADYVVRAPIAGVVASVDVKRGDQVSSGTSAVTVIAEAQVAEFSLSEVDAASVKVGQRATLTFDALPDLELSGRVAELTPLGTVSQGVVTYKGKIAMDVQDERVLPSMSVSAAIITAAETDALLVPNSAVKKDGDMTYVEVTDLDPALDSSGAALASDVTDRRRVEVKVGISNDTMTAITSGLEEGQTIIVRDIKAGTASASAAAGGQSNVLFGAPAGGAVRMVR